MPNVTIDGLNRSTLIRPDPAAVARQENRERAQRSADNAAGRGGNTSEEIQVLKALRTKGPVENAQMLHEETGIPHSEISRALSDLEARGLVGRSEHGSLGAGGSRIEAL
ncbi:helix-turn-helix transcriptional regulator [Lichenibacterium ramalinae]|uniref:MarR family transcriptional regulator n=1 Tax=Lichenibacterium ramalinae TaxID=2316527 RepID=A0A4Q2R527_9HYPH|nr:helix-turn-helix domain-containing protein [Lichenibacterium ramalinae]RYB01442.1 MarR family transcriptional regulator [Lichenibacterium ramalinae]